MTDAQFMDWGWRLPFLLSALLIVVGMFIRLSIVESPAFLEVAKAGKKQAMPILVAVRDYRRNVLLAMGMRVAENLEAFFAGRPLRDPVA